MNTQSNNSVWETSRWERVSYGLYFLGQNFLYMIVTAFSALFLINRGLNEVVVASILLAPKIWDAVNDPIFGIIVDKIKFRKGRFLPWLKISWIFIPATTILFFAMPDSLPQGAKIAWAVIAYILWDMAYTMCDAPIFALSTTMSSSVKERTAILSLGRLFATIGSIFAVLGIEALYLSTGWVVLAIGLSVLAMIFMLPVLLVAKERSHAEIKTEPTFKKMFQALVKNKYLLVYFVSYFLIAVTMTIEILIPIFAQYVLGSTEEGTILLAIVTVPMIGIAALVPAIAKKVDKFWIYVASIAFFVIASIVQYFTDYSNAAALYISTFIRAIGFGGYNILLFLFVPDIMEYGHYVTGQRQEGVYFSLQTFMTKLIAAFVMSLTLFLLSWFGFSSSNADLATGMVDATGGQGAWVVFTLVPVVGAVLGLLVLIRFYKLRDKDVQLMSRHNNGEISREECEKQLSRAY